MQLIIEVNDYWALKDVCWCNDENFSKIEHYNLTDEYFNHLEMLMDGAGETPTDTMVNDEIRFGNLEEWIMEALDLDYVDNIEELQEIARDLYVSGAEDVINEAIDMGKGAKLWDYIHDQFNGSTSLQEVFEFIESDIDLESDLNEEEE